MILEHYFYSIKPTISNAFTISGILAFIDDFDLDNYYSISLYLLIL